MAEERQGWYPGKFAKGLLGKIKDHHAKFQEGGEYGTRTGAQQAQIAFDRAEGAANEGGVGQGDPALERISQAANMGQSMDFARDFDPANAESVREMQRNLNRAGYKDKYGNALDEDGKMGGLTESALRTAQADRTPESRYEARGSMGISGDLADPEMARMNLRGAAPTTEPGGQPIIGGESEGGWMQKLQDWGMIKDRPAPQQQSAGPGGRMGAYSRPRGGGGRNY
tara:strand:- start:422 stop:1102 length:681 start_codon:yes stop_codon:yes gene_type:complete